MKLRTALPIAIPLMIACDSGDHGPLMAPGEDCMECHGTKAKKWTAAGTLYATAEAEPNDGVKGFDIEVTDSLGETLTMTSNAAGNFYTAEELTPPFPHAAIEKDGVRHEAGMPMDSGACNSCHAIPPKYGAEGRLHWSTD